MEDATGQRPEPLPPPRPPRYGTSEPWHRALLQEPGPVLLPFLLSRALLVLTTLAVAAVRHAPPVDLWKALDGEWYLGIAAHGYGFTAHSYLPRHSSLAFFPLYPLLVHLGASLGVPEVMVGLAASNLAFVGALFYVRRIATLEWDEAAARRCMWLIAFFPTSFFTFAPYTEALFLFCAAGAYYHAHHRQGGTAGVFTAAALMTRSTGIILVPTVLALLGTRSRPAWLRALLPCALAGCGYIIYLQANHLGLTAVMTAERAWHRSFTAPWTGFLVSGDWLLHHANVDPGMNVEDVLALSVTLAFLGVTLWARPWLRRPAALYCTGFWLLVLCSPEWMDSYFAPFSSVDRFVLALFPLAIVAGARLPARLLRPVVLSSTVLMLGSAVIHLSGGWVG